MNPIVEVNSLEKSFGDKKVVKEISFDVKEGEILCLLGPNGAGKSTTINILCGILGYDAGEMKYKGKNINSKNGIGLSICDEIIKLHNGDLKIYSEENKGTEVYLYLPL